MARNTYFQDEIIEDKFNSKHLLRVMKYVIPYKKTFILVGILMGFAIGLSLLPALLIKHIVDVIIPGGQYNNLFMIIGVFFLIGMFDILLQYYQTKKMAKTGHTIIYNIRNDIFAKLQQLSFDYFDNRPTGKIVIRVTSYIDELANFFANTMLNFIINIIKMIVVIVFLFVLNYILALVVIATIIPMGIFIFFIRVALRKRYNIAKNKDSNRVAFIHENILGTTITKSFNRDVKNQDINRDIYRQSITQWRKLIAVNELFGPGVEGIWHIGNMMIYIVALMLIGSGHFIQVGTVIAFINYLGMFAQPLNQLAFIIQQFSAVSANLERIFDTIDAEVDIKNKENAAVLPPITGEVEFDNVSFSYDNTIYILEDFNLKVPRGKTIALVGPTGAGKSTVVNLIPRFYDVQRGRVLIDGYDVKDVTLHSLRSQMGIMMQDTFIFKGRVIDNIRYAYEDATDEDCINAAKKIFADDFIKKLPNGYNTELSERGEGLSAGERQLLSFARVILKDPKILILDEATSSIDTKTELNIQKALKVLLQGRTSFVIAHRLSTIRRADCILFIADKGIAEAGTHRHLMAKKGLYYELYNKN